MTGNHAGHGKHACMPGQCPVMVPNSQLFCRTHWYKLPRALRNAVNAAWDYGRGAGSGAHMAAMDAAIEYVRENNGHGLVAEGQHPLFGDPE